MWARAFADLGYEVRTVAGEGEADTILPWLARYSIEPPDRGGLLRCIDDCDLVVVENLLTIPLNVPASLTVADVLRGRHVLVHHHDPPWQRERHASCEVLPLDDPRWRHVTLTRFTERQFAERGISARTIYNGFDIPDRRAAVGERTEFRRQLSVEPTEVLLLHPVRAIERKNIPAAIAMAEDIDATYWLTGDAEDGYGPTVDRLISDARVRVLRRPLQRDEVAGAYAAADAVLFPSTWEGFGNPPIEAAMSAKPVVVGGYPAADELRGLGFRWIEPGDTDSLARAVATPDPTMLSANFALANRYFSYPVMRESIATMLIESGLVDRQLPVS
jgi:glycosyltransferase involved in cell wall biosynthesis